MKSIGISEFATFQESREGHQINVGSPWGVMGTALA